MSMAFRDRLWCTSANAVAAVDRWCYNNTVVIDVAFTRRVRALDART
jgi:hypothetical protein